MLRFAGLRVLIDGAVFYGILNASSSILVAFFASAAPASRQSVPVRSGSASRADRIMHVNLVICLLLFSEVLCDFGF